MPESEKWQGIRQQLFRRSKSRKYSNQKHHARAGAVAGPHLCNEIEEITESPVKGSRSIATITL